MILNVKLIVKQQQTPRREPPFSRCEIMCALVTPSIRADLAPRLVGQQNSEPEGHHRNAIATQEPYDEKDEYT
jgi:hypothetical protein